MGIRTLLIVLSLLACSAVAKDDIFEYFDLCFQPTAAATATTSTSIDASAADGDAAAASTSTTTEAADNHAWLDNLNCQTLTAVIGNENMLKIQAALTPVPIVNSEETASERLSENGVTYPAAATTSGPPLDGSTGGSDSDSTAPPPIDQLDSTGVDGDGEGNGNGNDESSTGVADGGDGGDDADGGDGGDGGDEADDSLLLQSKAKTKSKTTHLAAMRHHIKQRKHQRQQHKAQVQSHSRSRSNNPYRKAEQLWPNANVYFAYAEEASDEGQPLGMTCKARVSQAILEWEAATCLDFIPVDINDKTNGLLVISGEHTEGQRLCAAKEGAFPGADEVTQIWTSEPQTGATVFPYGCLRGTFLHNLGHIVGLHHTQQRRDAANYVTVATDAAFSTQYSVFTDEAVKDASLLPTPAAGSSTVDVDDPSQLARSFYGSVMLYANDAIMSINTQNFASGEDSAANQAHIEEFTALMGQRESIGVLDKGTVLAAYGCKAVKIGLTPQDSVTAAWFHPGQTVGQVVRKVRQFYLNLGTVIAADQVVLFVGVEGSTGHELTPLSALVNTFITNDDVVIRHELLQIQMKIKHADKTVELFVDLNWKVSRVREHLKFYFNVVAETLYDGNTQLSDDNTLVSYDIDGSEELSTQPPSAATAEPPIIPAEGASTGESGEAEASTGESGEIESSTGEAAAPGEATTGGATAEEPQGGDTASNPTPADRCWANDGPMNLRESANCESPILAELQPGTLMTAIGDDTTGQCSDIVYTWHNVRALNYTGWIADTTRLGPTSCTGTVEPETPSTSPSLLSCEPTVSDGKSLCSIGSCNVSESIGQNFTNLMNAAVAAGHGLGCSESFRTMARQIELRIAHCGGNTYYNIHEKPSTDCKPITAIPGRSNHEKGLAVDLHCLSDPRVAFVSTDCFAWMRDNAANYGLQNKPTEPWHWSVDGL